MSGLTILSDRAVHEVLINLSKDRILAFQTSLARCLRDYSVGTERQYQPAPGVVNRPNGQRTLFRPFTSPTAVGTKIIVDPAPTRDNRKLPLQGILTLCDENGLPKGIINAAEVTAYRTSLIAMIPYMWRRNTENIVIYGAGKQALWHIRLALALRGDEIKSVTVVNRSEERAKEMLSKIIRENAKRWKSPATLTYLRDALSPDSYQAQEAAVANADAIFCTVPSNKPVFPARYILGQKQKKNPYISAIGSWQPDMIELDPTLLKSIVDDKTNSPRLEHGSSGAILVDDSEFVMKHTGEAIQSQLNIDNMIEVGKVFHLRGHETERGPREKLNQWLEEGFVVYKSVGVSVTDLTAGEQILALAKERNLGTHLEDF
ncbi:NAD(P)-binding protein [Hypoxylon sp. FL0890]|nr:NAD(P)-binding protein [Hypoxylon sp. FL0890]